MFEKEIKEDGEMNYDRVDSIVQKYHQKPHFSYNDHSIESAEDKHMRQFTSKVIQISKNMYMKVIIDDMNVFIF